MIDKRVGMMCVPQNILLMGYLKVNNAATKGDRIKTPSTQNTWADDDDKHQVEGWCAVCMRSPSNLSRANQPTLSREMLRKINE